MIYCDDDTPLLRQFCHAYNDVPIFSIAYVFTQCIFICPPPLIPKNYLTIINTIRMLLEFKYCVFKNALYLYSMKNGHGTEFNTWNVN